MNKSFFIKSSSALLMSALFVSAIFQNNNIKNLKQTNSNLNKVINNIENDHNLLKNENETLKKQVDNCNFKTFVKYDFYNITTPSAATPNQLKYALYGTDLYDYADVFVEAEKLYGINSIFMIGLVANESAWLTSDRTLRQNNVTGYAVYSNSSEGATFKSIDDSILKTAKLLSTDYVSPSSKHYNGLSVKDINIMYSGDKNWYKTINSISNDIEDKINYFMENIHN